jgi:uncharacterized protein with HEPN domain
VPPRDWQLRIEDMLDAISAIVEFVRDTDFDAFRRDRKTVDAVVRNLEVIGEAARFVPEEVRKRFPAVPWQDIVGMRSILIHQYFGIDFDILWATVQKDLPALASALRTVLDSDR